jgi:hypothetical protein
MALVAGGLSLSLVVTTPSNAQAFVPVPVLPAVFGATSMVIPELMATSAILGPVGWGIAGATAVGIGLYATKDYWLPYVTGDFGKANPSCPTGQFCGSGGSSDIGPSPSPSASASPSPTPSPSPTYGGAVNSNITLANARVSADGRAIVVDRTFAAPAGSFASFSTAYILQCQNDGGYGANGGARTVTNVASASNVQPGTVQLTYTCTFSDGYGTHYGQPTGFKAGAAGDQGLPSYPTNYAGSKTGPGNSISWGTLAPADINPRTDATKYVTTVECIKPDGTLASISAESLGGAGGLTVPSCAAAGLGHGTGKMDVDGYLNGSPNKIDMWNATAPAPTRAQPGCKLAVFVDGKECAMGVAECVDWSSLSKDPTWEPDVSCQYGPYSVPIELCNPIEQAYEPGGAPATDPNTDGDPGTRSDTQPDGSTQPRPSTDPNAPPGTGTGTGTVPGGFPTTGTTTDPDPCLARAWSWNPADFVKNPVVCALKDMFVPKMDIQARSNQLRDDAKGRVPVSWISTPIQGPGGGGCPNWVINVGPVHQNVVCDSSFTAAILAVRYPLFGLVASAMVWPLIRAIWYAAIPVLRVSPGSHK